MGLCNLRYGMRIGVSVYVRRYWVSALGRIVLA